MNSSTSSSDARSWRRFLFVFGAVLSGVGLAVSIGLLAIDPYDTGHFTPGAAVGVAQVGPRFANASRGRDPRFDSALIGNSHIQLLSPERLNGLTGNRFVSLSIPGTGPREQLTVARWFLRHHPRPAKLVLGIDQRWCRSELSETTPFPYWLYTDEHTAFAAGLLRAKSFEMAGRKIQLKLGLIPAARPDGYDDYEAGRTWSEPAVRNRLVAVRATDSSEPSAFPGVGLLADFFRQLPDATQVVIVYPPVHVQSLPEPGSPADRHLSACKSAYRTLAGQRPGTTVLDFLVEDPMSTDIRNFWDSTHYASRVAVHIEAAVGDAARSR